MRPEELQKIQEQLEGIIDKAGLACALKLIELTCRLKADHIMENWQDDALARAWEQASVSLERPIKKVKFLGL